MTAPPSPRAAALALALALAVTLAAARTVSLSNTALPLDTAGNLLVTGELTVVATGEGKYAVYTNDWGGCPGVDCCTAAGSPGCAACCFAGPSDPCVYTANHSVRAYATADFATYEPLGVVLAPGARRAGVEFRPQVVFCAPIARYVMWYEDRWTNATNRGYAVAWASAPGGPFTTVAASVELGGRGRVGDFDVFVDPADGRAWHVRTGLTLVPLAANCSAPAGAPVELPNAGVEGPALFRRAAGDYFLLAGVGCCACRGGSNVVVYRAAAPRGPWRLQGDVGSNRTAGHVFDAHSPYNYVTRAQASKVVAVPSAGGETQWLLIGNQWVTATAPGRPRDQDLLYFTKLAFDAASGDILQLVREDACELSVP